MPFLPATTEEMARAGWERPDIVLVTGDAYVDHPSFGAAIIGRVLEADRLRVCVLAQPDVQRADSFTLFGRPRIGFFVMAGNIDSMVAHYTAALKRRSNDAYSPGGRAGHRPDRAITAYCRAIRAQYPDIPMIIGGLEASLRRFAHYDYWSDSIRPSILLEAGADLLVFGMGEAQTREIARRLSKGDSLASLRDIRGTCYAVPTWEYTPGPAAECPSFEQVDASKRQYAVAARIQQDEQDAVRGRTVIQRHGGQILVQNPPMPPVSQDEFDRVYALPYERTYHPMYEASGGVPALKEVEFSIIHNRGCFGACNFCSLAFHQGRQITCRSAASVVEEAKLISNSPHFKGYIHDVGGPTANFRAPSCTKQVEQGLCKGVKCLAPEPCAALQINHSEYLGILREIRALPGIERAFIRSGIRYDYLMQDPDETFFRDLVAYHISGQLKVAPEHCVSSVLDAMGKPHIEAYRAFARRFYALTKRAGKEQYLVPYLMSSHPGCTLYDAVELALFLKKERIRPEQVQDFYPTPGTISTAMFYTGLDPYTMKEIHVPSGKEEKAMQRALLQYFDPRCETLVVRALRAVGRSDLIGPGPGCLVNPRRVAGHKPLNVNAKKGGGRRGTQKKK